MGVDGSDGGYFLECINMVLFDKYEIVVWVWEVNVCCM